MSKREPRTHDFRRVYWGHNFKVDGVKLKSGKGLKKDKFQGWTITTPNPQEGDLMVWRTPYGEARAVITKVKWCGDPHDMCMVEGRIVERLQIVEGVPL